jgi:hypothetical protein
MNLTHLSDPETGMGATISPEQGVMEVFTATGQLAATVRFTAEQSAEEVVAGLTAAGWVDSDLWQRFQDERDWARWVQEFPLADGSMASSYVTPRHPLELRETMVWSVDAAHALALAEVVAV